MTNTSPTTYDKYSPSARSLVIVDGLFSRLAKRTTNVAALAVDAAMDFCGIKKRYVLTRDNRIRLRYLCSGAAGLALVVGLYAGGQINPQNQKYGTSDFSAAILQSPAMSGVSLQEQMTAHLLSMITPGQSSRGAESAAPLSESAPIENLSQYRDESGQIRRDKEVIETREMIAENQPPSPAAQEKTIEILKGDTLSEALSDAGITQAESRAIVAEISHHISMKSVKVGQKLAVTLDPAETESGYQFASLTFSPDPLRTIDVFRDEDGDIKSTVDSKQIAKKTEARQIDITGSVYADADKADLPDRITANTISLFSYAVDFQRDVKAGDKMQVMYDSYRTDDGYLAKTGDIIFARMMLGDKEYAFYRYQALDGQVDYYTADGRSIRKSAGLMKTPVAFGRMSSGFGMRRHPILGYSKMHKGVDFAAPTGTKIYASGDGVIERAAPFSSFGNYIKIRHSSKLETAYAHLSRFAPGITPGTKVKQGQLIGYVGTTGRSTGAHLHYEVIVNGVQVNPGSVKVAVDNALQGKDLQRFKANIKNLNQQYVEQIDGKKLDVAAASPKNPSHSIQ